MRLSSSLLTILLGLLLSCLAASALAIDFPATRAGQAAESWFEAHSSGEDAYRAWVTKWRDRESLRRTSIDARVTRYSQMSGMLGDLTAHEIIEDSPSKIGILASSNDGAAWFHVNFEIQASVPFKVSSMGIAPADAPAGAPSPLDGWSDPRDLMQRALDATQAPAMAAALVVGDTIVFAHAAGFRVYGESAQVSDDDLFHYGSVTKSFTALLIARLIESEQLRWDSTLGELFEDMEMLDAYRQVTISQLLRHRGSIPAYTSIDAKLDHELKTLGGSGATNRAAFVQRVLQENPVGAPGEQMSYSNAGFAMLGHIAERIDGRSWEQQLEEEIFRPLDMTGAGLGWPATPSNPEQPRGHWLVGGIVSPHALDHNYEIEDLLAPAGDIHGSARDLALYARNVLQGLRGGGDLISSATRARLHNPGDSADANYGGGWVIEDGKERGVIHWHNGSAGTFYSLVRIESESNRAAVVIFNIAGPGTQGMAGRVALELLDWKLSE